MTLTLFEKDWRDVWNGAEPTEPVGAIFTRDEITEFIMDLAGYVPDRRLAEKKLLEPSCGDGAFLKAAIRRLLDSEIKARAKIDWDLEELSEAIRACDVNSGFVEQARAGVAKQLHDAGCPAGRASELSVHWIEHADFLLKVWREKFDYVIGNPPYVRIEDIPTEVMSRYRELYPLCIERADLYIAFFEQGLHLLSSQGSLSYICANRFTKNLYGRSLRQHLAQSYRVKFYLNLEHTQPFVSDVSAYPCVVVIDKAREGATRAATLNNLHPETLAQLLAEKDDAHTKAWAYFTSWYKDGAPWIATNREDYRMHTDLALKHPLLEAAGENTRVGIGVATGNDDIYILSALDSQIETECQLPLVMAADVSAQQLKWSGHYLVNPYSSDGENRLRDLKAFPGLKAFFERNRDTLMRRHTAQKNPDMWFRTIDKVNAKLTGQSKLLLPDIQAGGVVGMDEGKFYPHHNLYWVTSSSWNLRALQAILRSSQILQQVKAISVQMRGGSVRYQAQVLRKLRIPRLSSLSDSSLERLAAVASSENQGELDAVVAEVF